MREGIPAMAARAWAGKRGVNITSSTLNASIAFLAPNAPGQNLDRRPASLRSTRANRPVVAWNQRDGQMAQTFGKGSFGPPYTLSLNASAAFAISGADTSLAVSSVVANHNASNATVPTLVFTTNDGFPYPLRSVSPSAYDAAHPGRIWANDSASTHEPVPLSFPVRLRVETDVHNGSRVWVNEKFAGRFEVFVFGGRNTVFSWSQMALAAPLDSVQGGVDGFKLEEGVGLYGETEGNGSYGPTAPPDKGVAGGGMGKSGVLQVLVGLVVMALFV